MDVPIVSDTCLALGMRDYGSVAVAGGFSTSNHTSYDGLAALA
jgi:hypothetical protein